MESNITTSAPVGIDDVQRKMHFTGKVIKTTLAGAIVDIGLDTPGVVHISQLQKEPVKRVEDVVQEGQEVDVWVRRVYPKKDRIELTMVKPLDLEWREIEKEMVLKGKVTRIEKFGVFVDIGAERPGLVHISELTHDYIRDPKEIVKEGDEVEVKVLDVNRQKKQIKLSMKALEEKPEKVVSLIQTKVEKKEQKEKGSPEVKEIRDEPVPTAMEVALREAMDKVKSESSSSSSKGKRKSQNVSKELEGILHRTLKNRVATKQ